MEGAMPPLNTSGNIVVNASPASRDVRKAHVPSSPSSPLLSKAPAKRGVVDAGGARKRNAGPHAIGAKVTGAAARFGRCQRTRIRDDDDDAGTGIASTLTSPSSPAHATHAASPTAPRVGW